MPVCLLPAVLRIVAALLATIALLTVSPAASASSPPPANSDVVALVASDADIAGFFDDYMRRKVEALEVPGAAVVVVRSGRVILQQGYGVTDLASKQPIDVDASLFRAASISKLLPWLLVMQLVEAGRIDLDADLEAYLDFSIPRQHGQPLTMRQLMTHSAGFPERFHGVFTPGLATPLGETLAAHLPERVYPPGSTVAYSNYGAALAGYIVQRLHGKPWEQVVEERVFAPLGMRHSTVAQPPPAPMLPSLVSTYTATSAQPVPFRTTPLAPMGALTASPADMGRLLRMLMDGGVGEHGRLLSTASVARMTTLHRPLGPGLPDGMGLGLLVGVHRGVRYAGHAGNMSTLATDLELVPEHGLGWYYVFSTQGPGEAARGIREELLDAVVQRFLPEAAAVPQPRLPSSAGDAEGSYVSTRRLHGGPLAFSGLMNLTVVQARDDGSLHISSSGRSSEWLPAGRDRFVERRTGTALALTRDNDGRVVRMASAALYPVAEFERAPAFVHLVPWVAAFSALVYLVAIPLRLATWSLQRWRGRSQAASGKAAARAPDPLRRWASRSFWLLALTLAGWAAVALALAIDFANLFLVPLPLRLVLGALTLGSGAMAALLLVDAWRARRDPARGRWRRVGAWLVGFAAVGLAALFYLFGVWQFSSDW